MWLVEKTLKIKQVSCVQQPLTANMEFLVFHRIFILKTEYVPANLLKSKSCVTQILILQISLFKKKIKQPKF